MVILQIESIVLGDYAKTFVDEIAMNISKNH